MTERVRMKYHKPSESSEQYEYDQVHADEHLTEDEKRQKAQRKAGEIAASELTDIDEILEEIDGILEENATEFMDAWIQKGGE